ncbi:MAG: hypothetical protein KGL95_07590, partial [Patescibacteria group bacterium]|nr:hypothetical protein [Patescibacteria group bacterium]
MSLDDEKTHIQLNVMTRILEKELYSIGLLTDFDLIQSQTPINIERCLPEIILYEQIIRKSLLKEIRKQHGLDKVFFGMVNFHYNSKKYSKALELLDFMLLIIPSNFKIHYNKGRLYELLDQPKKA